jgi:hypothetical protein
MNNRIILSGRAGAVNNHIVYVTGVKKTQAEVSSLYNAVFLVFRRAILDPVTEKTGIFFRGYGCKPTEGKIFSIVSDYKSSFSPNN